tara:strand:+ start:2445 stop:3014 length:570 start_codon:yes stop_codon:yes gene_type:complete
MTERTYTADEVDAMIARALAREREQPAQQPTNCRHCGGADNVLCAGQCKVQPAQQEPVADSYVQTVPDKCDRIVWRGSYYHLPLKQPAQQEPVAWKWQQAPIRTAWGDDMVVASVAIDKDHTVDLYCEREQAPKVETMFAQRTWAGLTDEEIEPIAIDVLGYGALCREDMNLFTQAVRAIEAKLKEKNT